MFEGPKKIVPDFEAPAPLRIENEKRDGERKELAPYKEPSDKEVPDMLSLYSDSVDDTKKQLALVRERLGIPQNDEIPPSLQTEIEAIDKANPSSGDPENTKNRNEETRKELQIIERKRTLLEERITEFISELESVTREKLVEYSQAPASKATLPFESRMFAAASPATIQELVRIFLDAPNNAKGEILDLDLLKDEEAFNEELTEQAAKAVQAEDPDIPTKEDTSIIDAEYTEVPEQLKIEDQRFRITDQREGGNE